MNQSGNETVYQPEELLPIVTWLAEKYTSKESSSVTWEKAQTLMEAVIYCIREFEGEESGTLVSGKRIKADEAYRIGYDRVVEKVRSAREVYDEILKDFDDYGCRNYKDTLLNGMPQFFLYYDARYQPQDHILTLDYPTAKTYGEMCGIDIIYRYLCDIVVEKRFLACFEPEAVRKLLARTEDEWDIIYMGNLCELVLVTVIECLAAGKSSAGLEITVEEQKTAQENLWSGSRDKTELRLKAYVKLITDRAGMPEAADYFAEICHDYAVRISASHSELV